MIKILLIAAVILVNIYFCNAADEAREGDAPYDPCILTLCVQLGKTKEVEALLKGGIPGVGAERNENMPLYYSISMDRPDCLYLLLNSGIDPNYEWSNGNGGFPLSIAAQHGRIRCVELLLNYGAKINQTGKGGRTALYRAIIAQDIDIINLLSARGAKLSKGDRSGLDTLPEALRWITEKGLLKTPVIE